MNVNLPKEKLIHWDNFKAFHSKKIVDFVQNLLGQEVNEEFFITNYVNLTRSKKSPSRKRKDAKKQYNYLFKHDWIKSDIKFKFFNDV